MEKLMKILRRGWMYVVVAVFVVSMSGCAEEKKADAPSTESPETEAVSPDLEMEGGVPEAAESAASEAAVEGVSADPNEASDAANPEADPGVRDDIPVKGSK